MAKRLFLLLLFGFIGMFGSPDILSASDSFTFTGLESSGMTEEILAMEKVPEPETSGIASGYTALRLANYDVSFYIGSIKEYKATAFNLSYSGIYKFRKMVYGHNTGNLLGNLKNRRVGEIFTITEDGVAKKYRVASVQIYNKTSDGYLEHNSSLMTNIANTALGHDIALLTCHGVSYGNGDASQRLVVFADAV